MKNLDLSDFFTTKAEATDFSARLSNVSENLYETGFELNDILQKEIGVKKKEKFLTLLRDNNIPLDSNSELKKFLTKVTDSVKNIPTANLTLAIEPDKDTLKAISHWFSLNLKKQVVLETVINPGLVAGASVEFQGKHFDASIKPLFDMAFSEQSNSDTSEQPQLEQDHTNNK